MRTPLSLILLIVVSAAAVIGAQSQEGFRFKSGVEFVNVTATVTDGNGRFVSGLRQEDFTVYEDGQIQDVSHFSSDRVPVSLGIALDASGSMSPSSLTGLIFRLKPNIRPLSSSTGPSWAGFMTSFRWAM